MRTGIKYGFTHPGIRFLLIMLGITGLFIRPVIELMPGFAAQVFDSGSDGFAILMSAIGFGAMVSCLWVGMRGKTEGLTNLVTLSLLIQGIGLVLSTQAGRSGLPRSALPSSVLRCWSAGSGLQTLIQNAVDSGVRARVMSLFIVISATRFCALAAGWIASYTGMEATIAAGAHSPSLYGCGPGRSDQTSGRSGKTGLGSARYFCYRRSARASASSDFQRILDSGFSAFRAGAAHMPIPATAE